MANENRYQCELKITDDQGLSQVETFGAETWEKACAAAEEKVKATEADIWLSSARLECKNADFPPHQIAVTAYDRSAKPAK